MTPREAKEYLDTFTNYELRPSIPYASSLKLERVFYLLNLLDNPHQKIKTVHVAGTKGKGSTCVLTAFILQAAGYKVGLYTSPHLNDFRERIRILDAQHNSAGGESFFGKIEEREFYDLLERIKPSVEEVRKKKEWGALSFFELTTILALCYFREQKVDIAVLETGLGGRLDATNVVDSLVCAITPLSIEHTKQLGTTLKEIAAEKAAIIKSSRQTVVIAPQEKEALEVIKKRTHDIGSRPLFVALDIRYEFIPNGAKEQMVNIETNHNRYFHLKSKLLGRHQAINVSTAIGIAESLKEFGFSVSKGSVQEGVFRTVWPGRFEIIQENPLLILDGAHNPGSARILASAVLEIFPRKNVTLILGVSEDKDQEGICRALYPVVNNVILTKSRHPRAFSFKQNDAEKLFKSKRTTIEESLEKALEKALKQSGQDSLILVTGSLFIVGEARALCLTRN